MRSQDGSNDVDHYSQEIQDLLEKQGIEKTRFLIAVDDKGEMSVLGSPGTKGRGLTDEEMEEGIPAKCIKGISPISLVAYEGSQCVVMRAIVAGRPVTWVFCW